MADDLIALAAILVATAAKNPGSTSHATLCIAASASSISIDKR